MPLTVAVVVGSLRAESFNRQLAVALSLRPEAEGLDFRFVEIGDLPLYNQDHDGDQPAAARRLKQDIRAADAVIFATPEYNRSIPGVLKNALDHASRPYGDSAWTGKPAGIVGISPGRIGTALAQSHLRAVLAVLGMPTLSAPELYVQYSVGMFDEAGAMAAPQQALLGEWLTAFVAHAQRTIAGDLA